MNSSYVHIKVDQWLLCSGKYLSCSTSHATDCTHKSRGIVGGVQTGGHSKRRKPAGKDAKGSSPRSEVISAPFGTQRCQNGVSSNFEKCCVIAKIVLLRNEELRLSFLLAHCVVNGEKRLATLVFALLTCCSFLAVCLYTIPAAKGIAGLWCRF